MRTLAAALLTSTLALAAMGCGPTIHSGGDVAPELRRQFEVTVFTDDPDTGQRVLAAIAALGYTNPENEVLDSPNDEYNIKWGGAPEEMLQELTGIVEPMIHQELFPRHLFGPEDHDIFINLPICALGGAYRPETCGAGAVVGSGATPDPQFNAQGIPMACGFTNDNVQFGSISVGTTVTLGRHASVDGEDNWASEMDAFVGQTAHITELFGTDGSGCPVVHIDTDGGAWFWRVRDMTIGGGPAVTAPVPGPATGAIPRACDLTDATVQYGPVTVGTQLRLEHHTPYRGEDNWNAKMDPFIGRVARVTELSGVDGVGCALIKVDVDGGTWFWRVRDAQLIGGSSGFPQQCGLSDEQAVYGAATLGATVRLGRHRALDGDDNWASDMDAFVGRVGRVTELLGTDAAGCTVIHVDADNGEWAWRVRDLTAP